MPAGTGAKLRFKVSTGRFFKQIKEAFSVKLCRHIIPISVMYDEQHNETIKASVIKKKKKRKSNMRP